MFSMFVSVWVSHLFLRGWSYWCSNINIKRVCLSACVWPRLYGRHAKHPTTLLAGWWKRLLRPTGWLTSVWDRTGGCSGKQSKRSRPSSHTSTASSGRFIPWCCCLRSLIHYSAFEGPFSPYVFSQAYMQKWNCYSWIWWPSPEGCNVLICNLT